ncbi:MAG: DUF3592 domain-containing protein [Comamonadaceae bacterium]|nr:DUF3592 domain-containing protein [Comamonadaceae bacterium]
MDPLVFAAKLMGRAFGFIGLLVMAWGALSLAASIHAWLRCGRTQGEVIDFIEKPGDYNTRAYYAPVVRFIHGQQLITFESSYALPNPRYDVGASVRVAFKPEDPNQAEILDSAVFFLPGAFKLGFGWLFWKIASVW